YTRAQPAGKEQRLDSLSRCQFQVLGVPFSAQGVLSSWPRCKAARWFDHSLWGLAGHHRHGTRVQGAQSDRAVSCALNRGRSSLAPFPLLSRAARQSASGPCLRAACGGFPPPARKEIRRQAARSTKRPERGSGSCSWIPARNRSVAIVGSWDFPSEQSFRRRTHYHYKPRNTLLLVAGMDSRPLQTQPLDG